GGEHRARLGAPLGVAAEFAVERRGVFGRGAGTDVLRAVQDDGAAVRVEEIPASVGLAHTEVAFGARHGGGFVVIETAAPRRFDVSVHGREPVHALDRAGFRGVGRGPRLETAALDFTVFDGRVTVL